MRHVNVAILEALQRQFPNPSRFLLAVSGGRDSQVLLSAFSHIARPLGHHVVAVGVNHGLRAEADAELDLAEALAKKIKVPFERVQIKVKKGSNLLGRARDGRYEVLNQKKQEHNCQAIVTAHQYDDRVETVLIRLFRMTSFGSLAVLPELADHGIFRPLLKVTRAQITKYAASRKIDFADDPSNEMDQYRRVYIRKTLLPILTGVDPRIGRRLNILADEALTLVQSGRLRDPSMGVGGGSQPEEAEDL
jgi:tRNA(Ile)-lysidine synthase